MDNEQIFLEYQSDFYHYMISEGGITKKTGGDYISRLKFLSKDYRLDDNISLEYIDYIINEENIKKTSRSIYTNKHAMSDFRSGLLKFLSFIHSDYRKQINDSILSEIKIINNDTLLKDTQKKAIVLSRIGQGQFRKQLLDFWQGCSLSGISLTWLLIASHIKPWRVANNIERLDLHNGLLLMPNYDKLFDLGYISFLPSGKIIFSRLLSKSDRKLLHLHDNMHLVNKLEEGHTVYLKYHNDNCLLI